MATPVAWATPPEEVFAAVVELAALVRHEPGRTAISVMTWGPAGESLLAGIM